MKTLAILLFMSGIIFPSVGQVVSNVNWELEGNERIIITYDLAKVDNFIYFDVSVKVKMENKVIVAKALTGDVGNFIKIGTKKKIVWNMFEDITDLNGELSVEVVAFNPVPSTLQPTADKTNKDVTNKDVTNKDVPSPNVKLPPANDIPFWAGMGGIGATGVGLLTGGMKNANDGQDLYKVYKENKVETSSVYTELGSTRDDVYDEANKKYKNGTLLQAAGAAIFVTAGVIMVSRMIQMKKLKRRNLALSPSVSVDHKNVSGKFTATSGLTLRYRLGR